MKHLAEAIAHVRWMVCWAIMPDEFRRAIVRLLEKQTGQTLYTFRRCVKETGDF